MPTKALSRWYRKRQYNVNLPGSRKAVTGEHFGPNSSPHLYLSIRAEYLLAIAISQTLYRVLRESTVSVFEGCNWHWRNKMKFLRLSFFLKSLLSKQLSEYANIYPRVTSLTGQGTVESYLDN